MLKAKPVCVCAAEELLLSLSQVLCRSDAEPLAALHQKLTFRSWGFLCLYPWYFSIFTIPIRNIQLDVQSIHFHRNGDR